MVKQSIRNKSDNVDKKKKFLLYPDDKLMKFWEAFTTITLIATCMLTPIYIAFHEVSNEESAGFDINLVNAIIDIVFGIDIVIVFISPYYDDDFRLIDEHKQIAKTYLYGWFVPDVLAVLPIELIMGTNKGTMNLNGMIRITKLGRLYKLIKLTRMLRMLKMLKQKSNIKKITKDVLKLSEGF